MPQIHILSDHRNGRELVIVKFSISLTNLSMSMMSAYKGRNLYLSHAKQSTKAAAELKQDVSLIQCNLMVTRLYLRE